MSLAEQAKALREQAARIRESAQYADDRRAYTDDLTLANVLTAEAERLEWQIASIEPLRKKAFALAKARGFSGDAAKELLHDTAGVPSLSDLDLTGWQNLVRRMGGRVDLDVNLERPANVSDKQWGYIHALRRQLRQDEATFCRFVRHTTRLEHPRFLDAESARLLILGMLKVLQSRR